MFRARCLVLTNLITFDFDSQQFDVHRGASNTRKEHDDGWTNLWNEETAAEELAQWVHLDDPTVKNDSTQQKDMFDGYQRARLHIHVRIPKDESRL